MGSRAATIRATRSQLAILRGAYDPFISPSSEQRKRLSEETGLPPKWVAQWFIRQRHKDRPNDATRKNNRGRPATVNLKTTSPPTPEPEPVGKSTTSISKGPAMNSVLHQESKKIECLDVASGPSAESITVVPTLQTSVTTRGDPSAFLADRHLAAACAYTQHPTAVAKSVSVAKVARSGFTGEIPPTWTASPPSRNGDKTAVRNLSRLSVVSLPVEGAAAAASDPAYRQSLPSPFVPVSRQDWSHLTQRAVAAYQRGQVFYTHRPNGASGTHSQFSQATISRNKAGISARLAGAGVSNQDPNFNLTVSASSSIHPARVVHSLVSATADSSAVFMTNLDFSGSRQTEGDISFMTALQTVAMKNDPQQHMEATSGPDVSASNIYEQLDVLDPSHAPLKYLTGILANFKSEDGSYRRLLVDAEIRRKVVDCLSNEDLLMSNPFVGAMGLSLLSRLGLM